MIQGIYSLLGSAFINDFSMNVWANNLANVQTPGFLYDNVVVKQKNVNDIIFNNIYKPGYIEHLSGLVIDKTITNLKKGRIDVTNNPLDFALQDENEFFTVTNGNDKFFTKAGNFTVNEEKFLMTADKKYYVMGKSGKIKIDNVNSLISDSFGRLYTDGRMIDELLIHKITDTAVGPSGKGAITKVGDNLINLPDENVSISDSPKVLQKHLEYSNVEPLKELTRIIETQRAFENSLNLVKIQDEMLERVATETAKVTI